MAKKIYDEWGEELIVVSGHTRRKSAPKPRRPTRAEANTAFEKVYGKEGSKKRLTILYGRRRR